MDAFIIYSTYGGKDYAVIPHPLESSTEEIQFTIVCQDINGTVTPRSDRDLSLRWVDCKTDVETLLSQTIGEAIGRVMFLYYQRDPQGATETEGITPLRFMKVDTHQLFINQITEKVLLKIFVWGQGTKSVRKNLDMVRNI